MTRAELHKYFKVSLDKNSQSISYGGCPAFLPEEIDYFLNSAYYQVISNKFTGNNPTKVPFEQSVKRIADLQNLIRTDKSLVTVLDGENSCKLLNLFDSNRMFFVEAVLNFDGKKANVLVTDHNKIQNFIKTHNNNPWIENPIAIIEDNSIIVYYDTEIVQNPNSITMDLTYVKYPVKIENLPAVGLSEIPDNIQFELIDRAVLIALDNIESKRIESKSQLNQINE